MLESTVGGKVLQNGIKKYLEAHKFGNAVTDDLWQAISDAFDENKDEDLNKNKSVSNGHGNAANSKTSNSMTENKVMELDFTVKELMDTWTLQTGYPIVTFTQQNNTNIYSIDQQRFLSAYKVCNALLFDNPQFS